MNIEELMGAKDRERVKRWPKDHLRADPFPLSNALLTTASTASCLPFRENRFFSGSAPGWLLAFVLAAYRPDTVFDWALENALVCCFILALIWSYRKLPLSDLSYLCILVYLVLHEWGAHYKYSDVPLGEWMKVWLHTHRNHYDRIVALRVRAAAELSDPGSLHPVGACTAAGGGIICPSRRRWRSAPSTK